MKNIIIIPRQQQTRDGTMKKDHNYTKATADKGWYDEKYHNYTKATADKGWYDEKRS